MLLNNTIRDEHTKALALLTAVHEGEDGVMSEIHRFLKQVKKRKKAEGVARRAAEIEAAAAAAKKAARRTKGRKNSGKFVVVPRYEFGRDYGAEGICLAEKDDIRLVWRYGCAFWADALTGYTYTPGNLSIQKTSAGRLIEEVSLTDNHRNPGTRDTRLTKRLVQRYAEQINTIFGCDIVGDMNILKQTVLVGGPDDDCVGKAPGRPKKPAVQGTGTGLQVGSTW